MGKQGCSKGCVSLLDVCEGSTLKCPKGNMSLSRSLGQTLIAAASTMAFFAAFNWQFAPIVSSTPGTLKRWFKHIALALAEPFYAYSYSVLSAFIMWGARGKLPRGKRGWGQEIAIILNCPLYIEIPAAYAGIAAAVYMEKSRVAEEAKGESLVDVEIPWGSSRKSESAVDSSAEIPVGLSTDESNALSIESVKGDLGMEGLLTNEETNALMVWMKDLKIEPETTIKDWHSAELPAKPGNYQGIDCHSNHSEGFGSDHTKERYYIKLNPSPFYSREVHERFLLLALDLVPEYEQIRFLRSRSTFQAVVTTLQALGYVLSVVQRMLSPKGHDEVSPLEAILSAFNVLVILQLLLNLYSCVHYQRPLLLRLHQAQFSAYYKAQRCSKYKLLRYPFLDSHTSKIFLFIGAFISLILLTMIQLSFIRYALSYLHHRQKCLLCSLSTFIFCLLALSAFLFIGILNSRRFRELSAQAKLSIIIRIYSSIVNTTSIAIALAATIISWNMFNKPNINLFAWIVPHVSS